ncbi:MAG: LysM peptidoglycan-binding domain-containing protein [Saprospiraceae bacterium]|nr:LysM peptidoglycan-binding domain-containing protein [Saprospiraceae bacterium]
MSVISTYTVVKGDTLFAISKKFKMTVDDLKSLNGLVSNNLNVGQQLKVRTSGTTTPPAPPPPPATSTTGGSSLKQYVVVKGDTLFAIAKKFSMTVDDLKSLNGMTSNNLNVGQVLKVRGSGGQTTTPTPPVTNPTPTPPPVTGGNYLSARQQFRVETRQEAAFRRYFLTVPLTGGGQVVANMTDTVNSRFMVYPQGIMYAGQSHMELDVMSIQAVGLTGMQAAALQFVSIHEGSFDAINSYDKAIFSYGFIQFTGAAAVGGSLNRLLASMETNAPAAFQNIFKRVGIDTEGVGKNAVVTVLDDNGFKRSGDEAWLYIQRNVALYGAFIQAGFEPSLVREQLRMANELYVQPALNFKLDVTIGGIRLTVPRISDVFTSEAALTIIIALAINQGVGGMSKTLAPAVSTVATQQRLNSVTALRQIDERRVFENIVATATDERVINRVNSVFNSGLSFV